MAKSTEKRQKACKEYSEQHGSRALSPDEFLALENEPASEDVPPDLLKRVGLRNHILSTVGPERAQSSLTVSLETPDYSVRALAPGVIRGLAGRSIERVCLREERPSVSEPHRPPWVAYTPHPKVMAHSPALLRRVNGRRAQPHTVYGSDDRQIYLPSGYPWQCIGRVFSWDDAAAPNWRASGSGVLVGPRHVLTCGHGLPWGRGPGRWKVLFVPAYYDGPFAGVDSWTSDFRGHDTGGQDDLQAWDFAVLRLYDPLGERIGWFGTRVYEDDWEDQGRWTLAGYPGAIAGAERPSRHMGIAVIDDDSSGDALEIEHQGDASEGNSGGPLFDFWPEGPYAIGAHSGGELRQIDIPLVPTITLEDNNVAAGGAAMVNLVRFMRDTMP